MKKIIFTLIVVFLLLPLGVKAEECSKYQIEEYREELKNFTYTLEYADDYRDMNGEFVEGYFMLSYGDLPSDFVFVLKDGATVYTSLSAKQIPLNGDVYEVSFYNDNCEKEILNYQIKIPKYKEYCDLNKECNDVWFDGTYGNNLHEQLETNVLEINIKLVIVISSLLIIILLMFVILKLRRRRVI